MGTWEHGPNNKMVVEDGSISCLNLAGEGVLSVPRKTDAQKLRPELARIEGVSPHSCCTLYKSCSCWHWIHPIRSAFRPPIGGIKRPVANCRNLLFNWHTIASGKRKWYTITQQECRMISWYLYNMEGCLFPSTHQLLSDACIVCLEIKSLNVYRLHARDATCPLCRENIDWTEVRRFCFPALTVSRLTQGRSGNRGFVVDWWINACRLRGLI